MDIIYTDTISIMDIFCFSITSNYYKDELGEELRFSKPELL